MNLSFKDSFCKRPEEGIEFFNPLFVIKMAYQNLLGFSRDASGYFSVNFAKNQWKIRSPNFVVSIKFYERPFLITLDLPFQSYKRKLSYYFWKFLNRFLIYTKEADRLCFTIKTRLNMLFIPTLPVKAEQC